MKPNTILVNNVEINVYRFNAETVVAIKPICEALGVDYSRQLKKIKNDVILNSVMGFSPTTANDAKVYKTGTLPLKYVFGWLFTINPIKVKPEIRENLIIYKQQCYDALFEVFTKRDSLLKEKSTYQLEVMKAEHELKDNPHFQKLKTLKTAIKTTTKKFNQLNRNVMFEQLQLFS